MEQGLVVGMQEAGTTIFCPQSISYGASVCNDWKEVGRGLALVAFCKGGIGKREESVGVAGAFFCLETCFPVSE